MSDQPENANAETTQFEAVQPAPVEATQVNPAEAAQPVAVAAAPAPLAAEAKKSNRRVIGAAIAGAVAVAVIALAGVIGFAIGSHHSDNRAGFGAGDLGQIAQNFERHHDEMMQGFGDQQQPQQPQQGQSQQQGPGSMMVPNQQGQGPGQLPQGMMNQYSNQ